MNTRKNLLLITTLLVLSLACSIFSSPDTGENESIETPIHLPAESPEDEVPDAEPFIPAANASATIDCSLFDVEKFNAIAGEEFTLMDEQEDMCNFKSANGKFITIGGGGPADAEKAKAIFEMSLGTAPDAEWKVYEEGFQLGIAAGGMSVTGQGVSSSGNAILIIGVGSPTDDLDLLQDMLLKLVEEAARQLDKQW